MSYLVNYDGKGDILHWAANMRAKLISKGYKGQLLDVNRPGDNPAGPRAAWDRDADKALGIILTYLHPDISSQFETKLTPETLMIALITHFSRDGDQEVIRLEAQLNNLSYDGSDPIEWCSTVRNLVSKLTKRGQVPVVRAVRLSVLKAIEKEPEYKFKVEMIRFNFPNITLEDLWLAIGKFPYPIERVDEIAFAAMKLNSDNNKNMHMEV